MSADNKAAKFGEAREAAIEKAMQALRNVSGNPRAYGPDLLRRCLDKAESLMRSAPAPVEPADAGFVARAQGLVEWWDSNDVIEPPDDPVKLVRDLANSKPRTSDPLGGAFAFLADEPDIYDDPAPAEPVRASSLLLAAAEAAQHGPATWIRGDARAPGNVLIREEVFKRHEWEMKALRDAIAAEKQAERPECDGTKVRQADSAIRVVEDLLAENMDATGRGVSCEQSQLVEWVKSLRKEHDRMKRRFDSETCSEFCLRECTWYEAAETRAKEAIARAEKAEAELAELREPITIEKADGVDVLAGRHEVIEYVRWLYVGLAEAKSAQGAGLRELRKEAASKRDEAKAIADDEGYTSGGYWRGQIEAHTDYIEFADRLLSAAPPKPAEPTGVDSGNVASVDTVTARADRIRDARLMTFIERHGEFTEDENAFEAHEAVYELCRRELARRGDA